MKKFLFLLFISFQQLFCQNLDFYRENLTFEIYGDSCVVIGEYFFRSDQTAGGSRILYPFVINDSLAYPDSIAIFDNSNQPIKFEKTKNAVVFNLSSPNFFRAYYCQKAQNNYFEYILTTTGTWGKPLEKAYYTIKIHNKLDLVDLSIPYNKIEKTDEFMIYHITRKDYMPKRNIIIQWREQ